MPELPEVETVVRALVKQELVGCSVKRVWVGSKQLRRPWRKPWSASLTNAKVAAVRRRGKWIVVELADGGRLVVHLGMSGQFTVTADREEPDHLHIRFDLDNGRQLRFRDPRRFGSVELFPDDDTARKYLDGKLGPEPFDVDPVYFRAAVGKTSRPLKAILLDQRVVAGVGNIYADESSFRARLHPQREGASLTLGEVDRLREAIKKVLNEAIAYGGSSIDEGFIGGRFQDEFRVYGRTGKPCPACAAAIEVVRVAGRSSHYCPRCQPARRRAKPQAAKKH